MPDPRPYSEIEPKSVDWVWSGAESLVPGRIPRGMITVVAGRPGGAKGPWTDLVAADVSRAGGRVLFSSIEEEPGAMTRPRLEVAGADLDRVKEAQFMLPTHFRELTGWLLGGDYDLLVIDPVAGHLSEGIRRHSDNVREVLNPLKKLIERTNTACLMVEHVIKRIPAGSDPLYGIGGNSSGLLAAARMCYLFGEDPDDSDRRVLACVKPGVRDYPKALAYELDVAEHRVGDQPVLVPLGEIDFDASKLLTYKGGGRRGRPPTKRAAAAQWLTTYLYDSGRPMPRKLIVEDAKQFGISEKTLGRAAVEDVKVVKTGKGPAVKWDLSPSLRATEKLTRESDSLISDEEIDGLLGGS